MSSPLCTAYLAYIRLRFAGAHTLKFFDKVCFIIRTQREPLIDPPLTTPLSHGT